MEEAMVGTWMTAFKDPMKETVEEGEVYVHSVVRQLAGTPKGRQLILCVVEFHGAGRRCERAILEPLERS